MKISSDLKTASNILHTNRKNVLAGMMYITGEATDMASHTLAADVRRLTAQ